MGPARHDSDPPAPPRAHERGPKLLENAANYLSGIIRHVDVSVRALTREPGLCQQEHLNPQRNISRTRHQNRIFDNYGNTGGL